MAENNYNTTGVWPENDTPLNSYLIKTLDDHWRLCFKSAAVYVVAIFSGQWLMKRYTRFGLSNLLALWSGALAIFSILGSLRMVPHLFNTVRYEGFHASVCESGWMDLPVIQFWTSLFSISKIIELGDTVFIVLRKQPLIFLHWYHHITVLIYTWYSYTDRTSSGRWYIAMNYAVHSVMYSYYALRALKYRAPEWVRMAITLFQLSQMVVGVYIGFYVHGVKKAGTPCDITDDNRFYSFLMYLSYFLLFMKFFYDAYINPARCPAKPATNGVGNGANGHSLSNGQAKKLE